MLTYQVQHRVANHSLRWAVNPCLLTLFLSLIQRIQFMPDHIMVILTILLLAAVIALDDYVTNRKKK